MILDELETLTISFEQVPKTEKYYPLSGANVNDIVYNFIFHKGIDKA